MAETNRTQKRRFSRIAFHGPALLEHSGMTRECSLIDISLRGALFEAPHLPRPKVGDACSLDIPLDTGEARVKMVGQIAHVTGTRVGIRCTELDLDSAAHLRRLVQLNLGDEDMLQRELEALMDLGDE